MTSAAQARQKAGLNPLAAAAALLLLASTPAQAQFYTFSGAVSTAPTDQFPINGALQTLDLTGFNLLVGNSAPGSFAALAGAQLTANQLAIGNFGAGIGSVVITGASTRANLVGASGTRMDLAGWGIGTLTVNSGALLDAAGAACTSICGTFIGNAAGSTGVLNLSGTGSEVRTLSITIGQSTVVTNPPSGFNFGTPGGTTNASANVTSGGKLTTERATVGFNNAAPNGNGSERAFGTVVVDGAASQWLVKPNSQGGVGNQAAGLTIGNNIGGQGTVTIRNQGKLLVDGTGGPGPNDFLNIGSNGGKGTLTVTGVGSSVDVVGINTVLQVGRSGAAAQGSFSILDGATASALYTNIGRDSASGTLLIDGAGSLLSQVGVGTNQALLLNGAPSANFGRGGGNGQATVSNGGRWLISDGGGDGRPAAYGPAMNLAYDAGSTASLTITGANSRVELVGNTVNPGAGVGDNYNPFVSVGRASGATGTLNVSNGGKLLLTGNAVSTLTDGRSTSLNIGGYNNGTSGLQGTATVTGAGSEVIVTGMDSLINVGRGTASNGTLNVLSQGRVAATSLVVGAFGTGTVNIDNATVALSGVRANPATGSGGTIGRGAGGSGTMTLTNGAQLTIQSNTLPGGLNIGGDSFAAGGSGTVSLTGGSSFAVSGTAVDNGIAVGRNGSGVLSLAGASTVSVAAGGNIIVGREAGGVGLLAMSAGSTLNSEYIGLAIRQGVETGGIATMIVNNSTVNTTTLEVGLLGFLGGNNAQINGQVVLHGVLSPGESPGRIVINGSFRTGSGRLILEVQSNGAGGFNIDELLLTQGSSFDFRGLDVEFSFLGDTDPNAFAAAGGMDLDNFVRSLLPSGEEIGLSEEFGSGVDWDTWFSVGQFSARSDSYNISNFTFAPGGVISFNANAIPAPATMSLVMLALLGLSQRSWRRSLMCR